MLAAVPHRSQAAGGGRAPDRASSSWGCPGHGRPVWAPSLAKLKWRTATEGSTGGLQITLCSHLRSRLKDNDWELLKSFFFIHSFLPFSFFFSPLLSFSFPYLYLNLSFLLFPLSSLPLLFPVTSSYDFLLLMLLPSAHVPSPSLLSPRGARWEMLI